MNTQLFAVAFLLAGSFANPSKALDISSTAIVKPNSQILIADASDYGGGWAVPSLEKALSIGRDAVNRSIFDQQICSECPSTENSNSTSSSESQSVLSPVLSSANLNFQVSASRREQNLSQFVEKTRATDPQGAAQMAQLFASTDVIEAMGQDLAPYGLRVNNVADAYTVYWINAWLGAQGRQDDVSEGQVAAVKNQAVMALSATPQFAAATDAQKQELAEALLIQAALVESAIDYATSASDPTLLEQTKAAIAQGAQNFGLDLYQMNLTPQGFLLKE
jgi:hypothetical protein